MSSYMQMGHDTQNLVGERDLEGFAGIVLSPANRDPSDLSNDIPRFRDSGDFEIALDPQLYVPRSNRGSLPKHSYFPSDIDTSDLSSISWWQALVKKLAEYAKGLKIDTIASPAVLPRTWDDEYYAFSVDVGNHLQEQLPGGRTALQTAILDLATLGESDSVLRAASIVSGTKCPGCYVVIVCSQEPRREIRDVEGLSGAMHFVSLLEASGKAVLVAYTSSDMLLYKAAGASHCATGKFFNLRRFTESRFGEESDGGGQLAYWFEHSLLAFLRESDIQLLQRRGRADLLGHLHSDNDWSQEILTVLQEGKGEAWVGRGWRQFLNWFWRTEHDLADAPLGSVNQWLRASEERWLELEDADILMSDPRCDGGWLRPWRQALSAFRRFPEAGD